MGRHAVQLSILTTSGHCPKRAVSASPSLNSEWNKYSSRISFRLQFRACRAGAYARPWTQTLSNSFSFNPWLNLFRRHTASYPKLQGLIQVGFRWASIRVFFSQLPRNTHAAATTMALSVVPHNASFVNRTQSTPTKLPTQCTKPSIKYPKISRFFGGISPLFFLFLGTFSYF